MTDQTWPPPWTLKPVEGDPEWTPKFSEDDTDRITWDISFGFTLNVGHADHEDDGTPLAIGAHFSDADAARGFVKREVTPDQLDRFALLLHHIATQQRKRQAAKKADA